jgi:hypothetical protein
VRVREMALLGSCLIAGCSPRAQYAELEVTATDYAFTAPDTVASGETAVSLVNHGTVMHEVKVIRLLDGVNLERVLPLAMADSAWGDFRDPTSGILTARAGLRTPGRLLIDFQPGRTYLLLCSLAQSDTSRLHSELGMVRVLSVR